MKGPQDKQPGSPDQQDHEEKPVGHLVAKVLEYEPYLLALEIERDQDSTYLLGEILQGNLSAEPRILEIVEFVKKEGMSLTAGKLEAAKRLGEVMETNKALSKTDAIRLLYDSRFEPDMDQPQKTIPRATRAKIKTTLTAGLPRERIKEAAIDSIREGLTNYMRNIEPEIDGKITAAETLLPKKPEPPQTVSFSTFSLEDWDPVTDDNIVIVREKPRPRITLDTNPGNNNLKSRLQ